MNKKDIAGQIIVIVLSGCILAIIGLVGRNVYNGATVETANNKATDKIILQQVAKNTAAMNAMMKYMEDQHSTYVETPITPPEVKEEPPVTYSLGKRLLRTLTLTPLWGTPPSAKEDSLYGENVECEEVIAIPIDLVTTTEVSNIEMQLQQSISDTALQIQSKKTP